MTVTDQIRNIKIALYEAEEHAKVLILALDAARLHTTALEHDLQAEMRNEDE
jgi:hypothetical protein